MVEPASRRYGWDGGTTPRNDLVPTAETPAPALGRGWCGGSSVPACTNPLKQVGTVEKAAERCQLGIVPTVPAVPTGCFDPVASHLPVHACLLRAPAASPQDCSDAHFVSLGQTIERKPQCLQQNIGRANTFLGHGKLEDPILPRVHLDEARGKRFPARLFVV